MPFSCRSSTSRGAAMEKVRRVRKTARVDWKRMLIDRYAEVFGRLVCTVFGVQQYPKQSEGIGSLYTTSPSSPSSPPSTLHPPSSSSNITDPIHIAPSRNNGTRSHKQTNVTIHVELLMSPNSKGPPSVTSDELRCSPWIRASVCPLRSSHFESRCFVSLCDCRKRLV